MFSVYLNPSTDVIQAHLPVTSAIVVGEKAAIIEGFTAGLASQLVQTNISQSHIDILQTLEPGMDCGDSTQFFIGTAKISVYAFARGCSRHNCRARPHLLTQWIRSQSKQANGVIVAFLPEYSWVVPTVGAIAKSSPLFSMKKSNSAQFYFPDCFVDEPAVNATPIFISVVSHATYSLSTFPMEDSRDLTCLSNVVQGICSIIDAPTNLINCNAYIDQVILPICDSINTRFGEGTVRTTVIRGTELSAAGLNGLYGVGKASLESPALVVLSYDIPSVSQGNDSIVLVGKGIMYDTGGLSLKTPVNMPGMKIDMAGSAGILGSFVTLVSKLQHHATSSSNINRIHAVLCIAENSVGPNATRPDDVHVFLSGKSVEINNTDAEGRLALADGVAYAKANLNPSVVIDMATLTGAQSVSTGKITAAVVSNKEWLERLCVKAGLLTGDLAHPLPYQPEVFRSQFRSSIADMKNSVSDRENSPSASAAVFIADHFLSSPQTGTDDESEPISWLHIDMAAPAWHDSSERSTAYGVALVDKIVTLILFPSADLLPSLGYMMPPATSIMPVV